MRSRLSAMLPLAAALAVGMPALPAAAQDAGAPRLKALAATCATSRYQGRAVDGAAVPGLAGMPAAYMVEQVKAFKSGARPATVMHQLAKGYSDAQIEQVAAYFAAQKK